MGLPLHDLASLSRSSTSYEHIRKYTDSLDSSISMQMTLTFTYMMVTYGTPKQTDTWGPSPSTLLVRTAVPFLGTKYLII